MTVQGPIDSRDLGFILPHEHILIDTSSFFVPVAAECDRYRENELISLSNLSWIRYNARHNRDCLRVMDEEDAVNEVAIFRRAGGNTIVDLTCREMGRNPLTLARISRSTGVHIIIGTGFYTAGTHRSSVAQASARELAAEMINEVSVGVDGTGIKAGIIVTEPLFSKVEAVDPYTVRITLSDNVPSMLALVLNFHGGMVLSKKAVEKYGDDFRLNPVGTGPFEFKEYIPKQKTILVAHPKYFRGKPKIDKIVYSFVPVDQAREMAFLKGELDMIEGVKQEWWVEKMKKEKNVIVDALPPGELTMVHFNMTKKPLEDIRVRRALAHAINRQGV